MKYYLDTEFHEFKKQASLLGVSVGKPVDTIELISIGIVAEDGREYYAICNEFDFNAAWENKWLKEYVLKGIHSELNYKLNSAGRKQNSIIGYGGITENYDLKLKYFKRLVLKYGKSREEIAKEIKIFISNYQHDDDWEEGSRYDSSFGNGIHNTYYYKIDNKNPKINIGNSKSDSPEFYAYYADYDWVVFCWLFGRMIDLPEGFPMYCRDLKQTLDKSWKSRKIRGLTNPKNHPEYPKQYDEHNALCDAKWNKKLDEFIKIL